VSFTPSSEGRTIRNEVNLRGGSSRQKPNARRGKGWKQGFTWQLDSKINSGNNNQNEKTGPAGMRKQIGGGQFEGFLQKTPGPARWVTVSAFRLGSPPKGRKTGRRPRRKGKGGNSVTRKGRDRRARENGSQPRDAKATKIGFQGKAT